jgi:hypothetical protein
MSDNALFPRPATKGLGKGQSKSILNGKGKNKGEQLALEDEKSDAQLLLEAQNKGKKMRDIAFATLANLEDSLKQMKHCKFWSKAAQKDSELVVHELKVSAEDLKKFIGKNSDDLELWKGKIMQCAIHVKQGTNQLKELKLLANKTGSVGAASSIARNKNK